MKNISRILGLGALCLAVAGINGCEDTSTKLDKRRTGTEVVYIGSGDTYTDYARKVRKKYPEQIKDVRTDDLWMYISEMNKDKPLIHYNNKGTTAVLPKF